MIKGDTALEAIYDWKAGQTLLEKAVPKTAGSGVHIITGPVEVEGAMPGDVVQIDILAIDPRINPSTGKCYGIYLHTYTYTYTTYTNIYTIPLP